MKYKAPAKCGNGHLKLWNETQIVYDKEKQ